MHRLFLLVVLLLILILSLLSSSLLFSSCHSSYNVLNFQTAMGGLGNGRRGGRSPPLLIAALVASFLVLGFNYWVSSSRNLELQVWSSQTSELISDWCHVVFCSETFLVLIIQTKCTVVAWSPFPDIPFWSIKFPKGSSPNCWWELKWTLTLLVCDADQAVRTGRPDATWSGRARISWDEE